MGELGTVRMKTAGILRVVALSAVLCSAAYGVVADSVSARSDSGGSGVGASTPVGDSTKSSAVARNEKSLDAVLGKLPAVIEDIALVASAKVSLNGLGLVVRNGGGSRVSVKVLDARGRAVLSKEYSPGRRTITVAVDEIPEGVYVYSVRIADSVYTRPFILTR